MLLVLEVLKHDKGIRFKDLQNLTEWPGAPSQIDLPLFRQHLEEIRIKL